MKSSIKVSVIKSRVYCVNPSFMKNNSIESVKGLKKQFFRGTHFKGVFDFTRSRRAFVTFKESFTFYQFIFYSTLLVFAYTN